MPTAVTARPSATDDDARPVNGGGTPERPPAARPVGRAEVMAAVLESATELFAEKGPDAVTVRQVADRAGVNHALIHRHYGTKQELLRVVLARALSRMAGVAEGVDDTREGVAPIVRELHEIEPAVRLVAWAILSGYPMDDLWPEYPAMDALRNVLAKERGSDRAQADSTDPAVAVVTAAATVLGWMIFRPLLERAAGLDKSREFDDQAMLNDTVQHLLDQAR